MTKETIISFIFILVTISGCATFFSRYDQGQESGITNLVQLTTDRSLETDPVISPDGGTLAFISDRSGSGEIWIMPINGGGMRQITNSVDGSWDLNPSWSLDGKRIVFQSNRVSGNWNIWTVELGGRGLSQITNNSFGSYAPSWNPKSKIIAFTAKNKDGQEYIWLINDDGSNMTQLAPGCYASWSPTGDSLVFSRKEKVGKSNYNIFTMKTDGSQITQITSDNDKKDLFPKWGISNPNKITYVSQYIPKQIHTSLLHTIKHLFVKKQIEDKNEKSEIWVINLVEKGIKSTQLTEFKGINTTPSWFPNEEKLVFSSNRAGNWDIWALKPTAR